MAYAVLTSTESGANSLTDINANFALAAPLASPTFTGTPTLPTGTIAVTQSPSNNSTKVATTAYVDAQALITSSRSGVSAGPASSSTQTITHGLGRTPTIIRLTGYGKGSGGTSNEGLSTGTYNATGNRCVYKDVGVNVAISTSTTFAIELSNSSANAQGVVGNVGATTFDIVWTASGDLSGGSECNFIWEAQ